MYHECSTVNGFDGRSMVAAYVPSPLADFPKSPAIVKTCGGQSHTAIQMSGFKTLKEGQKVEFEVKRGPKGLQAHNIKPL
jgi:'Cold-shock' DNA-binding domain